KGGWVSRAIAGAIRARPSACSSAISPGSGGRARARTRERASSTLIILSPSGRAKGARFAAGLGQQADTFDPHVLLRGLEHVVNGQAGGRDGGQRLHLDSGLAG